MGNGTIAPSFFTDAALKPFNPVPKAPAGPPPAQQAVSPIHVFVQKNQTATPEQVQAQFPAISLSGIQAILPGIKQELTKVAAPVAPSGPPPNPVQQAMASLSPPPPQKGPQLNAFTSPSAPGYEPLGKPQIFPQAVSGMPPSPPSAPTVPGPPPDALAARQATLAGIPGYQPGAYAPPGAGGVGMQEGPPMQDGEHRSNSFLEGLKRFAPALAVALLSKNNPQVGASILGGVASAQQRMAGEKAQQDAIDRQAQQQQVENDLNAQKEKDTRQWHEDEVKAKLAQGTNAAAISKAIEKAPDGASALAVVVKMDPSDSSGFIKGLTNADGSPKEKNPWYGNAAKVAHDEEMARQGQEKIDLTKPLNAAKIKQLLAQEGMTISHGKYYDAETGQVVPNGIAERNLKNITADYLKVKRDDQHQLDTSLMDFRTEMAQAAHENAAAHTTTANTAATKAPADTPQQKQIEKMSAERRKLIDTYIKPGTGPFNTTTPALLLESPDGKLSVNPLAPDQVAAQNAYNNMMKRNEDIYKLQTAPAKVTPRSLAGDPKASSVPVIPNPLGANIGATAKAMKEDGRSNQPHFCERVARQTYQQNTGAYNKYWAGTAKKTAQNFIDAGIAKPYRPDMPVPAGSLLYSTEMGSGDGHVQVVGNDGKRYDQYGENRFRPGSFNWYVPPPGGSTVAKSGPPPKSSPVVLAGKINDTETVFHAPRSKAEFDALTPAKKAAYIKYYKSQKKG